MSISIEALAEKGIHLVEHIEGELARFEQATAAGTKRFDGSSLEEALANVEAHLAQHPGALGTDIARSDGASESLDEQVKHSAEVGPSDLPQPAAEAEAEAAAEAAAAVDEPITIGAQPDAPADPAAEPASEPAEPAAPTVES